MDFISLDNHEILIINILFYVIAIFFQTKHRKFLCIGNIPLFIYFTISCVALVFSYNSYYYHKDLKLLPFIYLFLTIVIFSLPLFDFSELKTRSIVVTYSPTINYLSVFIVVLILIQIGYNIFTKSISTIFSPEAMMAEYVESHSNLEAMETKGPPLLISIPTQSLRDFLIPLFIYYLFQNNKKYLRVVCCGLLLLVINALLEVARGILFSIIISIPFIYFCVKERFSINTQKRIKQWICISLLFSAIAFTVITNARISGKGGEDFIAYSLENYGSQSFLIFNNYGLDANGTREGDRTMPLLRKVLGLGTSTNFYERREKYHNMLIDDAYFITFVGDFTLDFGPIVGLIILLMFAITFRRMTTNRKGKGYYFSQILIFYIVFKWVAGGALLWPFAEKTGNLSLLCYFLFYAFLRHIERSNQNVYLKKEVCL